MLFISFALFGYIDKFTKNKSITKLQLISLSLLILSMVLILSFYHGRPLMLFGVLLAVICGIAFYGYSLTSMLLLEKGNLSSSEILATRFWVILFIVVIFMPKTELYRLTILQIVSYLLAGFFIMIIPIYNYQQSLKKIGAIKTSIVLCFTPVVTYILFVSYNNLFEFNNFIISIIIAFAMLFEFIKPLLIWLNKLIYCD